MNYTRFYIDEEKDGFPKNGYSTDKAVYVTSESAYEEAGRLTDAKAVYSAFPVLLNELTQGVVRELHLKHYLSKILPELILEWEQDYWMGGKISSTETKFSWKRTGDLIEITDGEWLHVCWLAEQTFFRRDFYVYVNALKEICSPDGGYLGHIGHEVNASWQQKAAAMENVRRPK